MSAPAALPAFQRLTAALLLVAALLAACARPAPPPPVPAPAVPAVTVFAPAFGDADPHPWDGRDPAAYPVHGLDVSRWQGEVDWHAARAAGGNFVFIKATEGGDIADPAFARNWHAAAAAGVERGAYHYFYFCRPAGEQARWFIRHVPRTPGALPPVLDLEWTPRSRTCTRRPPPAVVLAEASRFLDILEAHYGQRPIVYTTVDFWRDTGIGRLVGTEFWLRSVAGHPSKVYPGQGWTFWQYSGTGLVPGITGKADLNVFAGPPEAWAAWLARRRQR
jgi:lysozyme